MFLKISTKKVADDIKRINAVQFSKARKEGLKATVPTASDLITKAD